MRRLLLNKTLNTRDLGGYTTADKHTTAYQVFLRSDKLREPDETDTVLLHAYNVTTIVDLRNDKEIQDCPCPLCNNDKFEYRHCKMFGDGRLPDTPEDVSMSYFEMADEQRSVLAIMKLLAKADGCVLFHCSAGKDRTGVLSALLLLLANVPQADIVADYIATQAYLYEMLKEYSLKNSRNIQIVMPQAEYMRGFLELFHQKYHSIQKYLLTIGLSYMEIDCIKSRFIET